MSKKKVLSKKTSSVKKPVKKTANKVVKRPVTKPSTQTWWQAYCSQRDAFYQTHPYSRFLIGLLIVSLALAFGMVIHDWKEVYIGMELDKEGIEYPYVKPVGIK